MAKKLISIRVSQATREKLDDLALRYGTQAEAVAVALHHLWQLDHWSQSPVHYSVSKSPSASAHSTDNQ